MAHRWIQNDEWQTIVANVPIVSVDLLVRVDDGLVFGMRENEPAAGYWFVPGGRVKKGETRQEAVHRIAEKELGTDVRVVESIGAYEHIYDTAEIDEVDGKHYVANGYIVEATTEEFDTDGQHSKLRVFTNPPDPLHKYVQQYLEDARSLSEWP